jgi:hypothetical protein
MTAAPSPCSTRALISDPSDQARPARSGASAQQQEAAEDECVGADHPLQVRVGEAEVGLDRRERDVHDRDVEDDHELDDAQQRERQPLGP